MNHTVTLQGYDGSTTIIPFDNTITVATLFQRYREQTGYGGYMELYDMDDPTEQPLEQEQTLVIRSNKTFLVQKSEYEAIPDKQTLQQLVDRYCDGLFTDEERGCYGPIEHWDVHLITDMSALFKNKQTFNQSLNNWDVSNVTDMREMFYNARVFNQPLNSWDVSKVTNMDYMFFDAMAFNQPRDHWDVRNVDYSTYYNTQ